MLVENTMQEALKAFLNGRKVRVITEYDDGSIDVDKLENMLPQDNTHYLVDVPAYVDPELDFNHAVLSGADQREKVPESVPEDVEEQKEETLPPHEKPEEVRQIFRLTRKWN